MTEPVYLAVTRRHGIEEAALHYDRLPAGLTGKHAQRNGLVEAMRIDTLPDAADWIGQPVGVVFSRWCWMRAARVPAAGG